ERLAAQKDVMAVVGPMTTRVMTAASERAQQTSLPMINFSQLKGTPAVGRYIFRMFLTPEAQARAVADYAVQILGLTRFAILHPNDAYGRKMRDAFWDRIKQLEAEVVASQSYSPDTSDFSKQIQNLTGVEKAERRVEAGYSVQVDFDAVFLPDNYNAIAMIAPQFAYHDVTDIRMLGTSLWHTPRLLATTSRYIQKAILPASFYIDSEREETKRFIQAFREANEDQTPGKYAAYGFDAGMLLLTLMDRDLVSTREGLIDALAQVTNFPGATGDISFSEDGEFISDPILLTVISDDFRLIQKSSDFNIY
ncbi:MAG: penicillin-binding protein activator, partial [Deltaproteobacteria bacterium]|nr:penicillin-binding protein activator [Deltaproteobacteria bacterium]